MNEMTKFKLKCVNYFLIILSILFFVVTYYYINKIGVIPNKYIWIFFLLESSFIIIEILLVFFNKIELYMISFIISIMIFVINLFGLYYVKYFDKSFDNNFNGDIINSSTFYLITDKDNSVESLDDITIDIPINYYKNSLNNDIAREKLGDYNYIEVNSLSNYFNSFQSSSYLLVDKDNYGIFKELNDYIIKDKFKIIYEFDIETVEKRNLNVKDSYNIFVIGKDFSNERDDLNMLITVNTKTHRVLFTSMPRDYYIDAVGYNFKDSLSNMFALGDDTIIKSIEKFYDITVDYKFILYTENLVDIVDKLGGIEFCSNVNFKTTHAKVLGTYNDSTGEKMYVKKGCFKYNGIEILTIARERVAFNPKGDHQRQENCRKILISILKKLSSLSTFANYTEILNSLDGLYKTTMNRNAIISLIRSFIEDGEYEIEEQHVGGRLYYGPLGIERWNGPTLYPDKEEVSNAIEKMKEVLK